MARLSESRIYSDLLDLAAEVFKITGGICKSYRMSVGRRMEDAVMAMSDDLLMASYTTDEEKSLGYHLRAMADYERLQFAVNVGVRVRCLTYRQQSHLAVLMGGIGRQATGLRKYAERRLREKTKGSAQAQGHAVGVSSFD